ncbi:MAG TPA: hypothetical protein VFI44_03875 [Ornithinibacter sp.]|nr:hypothetical protein [Ornithinibacter sp.]
MSTHVVPVVRHRASAVTLVLALLAAVAIAVVGVIDAPRAGSSEPRTTSPGVAPTPEWLQRYLDVEAPATIGSPAPAGGVAGTRPVNPGLR